jgi:Fic family protein
VRKLWIRNLFLIQSGLISEPILYLSRSIIRSKNEYYQGLNDVTSAGAWEPWILYMLRVVEQTASSTLAKIAAIRTAQAEIYEMARSASHGGQNADFLAALFELPYCRISTIVERCGVSRPTAASWLNGLVEVGILTKLKIGRDRLFVNDRFLHVLTRDEMGD